MSRYRTAMARALWVRGMSINEISRKVGISDETFMELDQGAFRVQEVSTSSDQVSRSRVVNLIAARLGIDEADVEQIVRES